MRNNVDKISTKSVAPDELDKQRLQQQSTGRKLERVVQAMEKIREKIAGLRMQLAEKRSLQKERGTAQTKRALAAVIKNTDS